MPSVFADAAALLRRSRYTIALTGAGISTPSGIPDFRSPNSGLWTYTDPLEIASIWTFVERPEAFYTWIRPVIDKMTRAQPNVAHRVLAWLEAQGLLECVVTQNIDSLHQAAGSRRVLELHGHARTAKCLSCGKSVAGTPLWEAILAGERAPRCEPCGGLLKPDFVLFGEPLDYQILSDAQQEALTCDTMLVLGTSLEVMPAADLPLLARRRGARLIHINLHATTLDPLCELVIHDEVAHALREIRRALGR